MAKKQFSSTCQICTTQFESEHKQIRFCSRSCQVVATFGDFETRFWRRVDKSAGPEACWPWTASARDGYGMVYVKGKPRQAARVAYELCVGPIPDGLLIRHTCDNPPCCNPLHLIPGTVQQNTDDRIERNRQLKGEATTNAKLTEDAIIYIRKADAAGVPQKQLAYDFDVTQGTISSICRKVAWKHI